MTTIRIPTGTIEYQDAPFVMPADMPERGYVDVRVELTSEQAADLRRQRKTLSAGYSTVRCQRSGNPPNTDTVPKGKPCTCSACTIDRCSAGAPFVLDAKDMERGGLYSEPLAAIGPVQSGTLREVKPR